MKPLTRRGVLAVAGVAFAALLAGCSAHPGTAAVVDGRTISQEYLDETYDEVNAQGIAIDKPTMLVLIIAAPYFIEAADENGVGVSAGEARTAAVTLTEGAGDGLVEFLRLQLALQNLRNLPDGEAVVVEVDQRVRALEMDINPRYGELNPDTAEIERAPLPWIVGS